MLPYILLSLIGQSDPIGQGTHYVDIACLNLLENAILGQASWHMHVLHDGC